MRFNRAILITSLPALFAGARHGHAGPDRIDSKRVQVYGAEGLDPEADFLIEGLTVGR